MKNFVDNQSLTEQDVCCCAARSRGRREQTPSIALDNSQITLLGKIAVHFFGSMEQRATLPVGRDWKAQIDKLIVTYRLIARRVLYLQPVLVAANREPGRSGVEPAISQAGRGAVGRGRSRSLGSSAQSGLSNRRACQLLKEYPRPRRCAESHRGPFPGYPRGCGYHRWPAPLASGRDNTLLAWALAFPDRASNSLQGHMQGNRCVVTGVDGDEQDRLRDQSQGTGHSSPAAHILTTAKIVEDQGQGREILFQIRASVARWVRRSGKLARKAVPPAIISSVVCFVT